jgi:hypothetical protein
MKMDDEQTRPETGGMRFGDDWRGVFIRGDDAINYYLSLVSVIRSKGTTETEQLIALAQLTGLADTLYRACQTQLPNLPPIPTECQEMKPFEEAVKR